jgi:hypothetical protein
MNFTQRDFDDAVQAMQTSTFGPVQLRVIDGIVSSGVASRLIHDMLTRNQSAEGGEARAVQKAMQQLEALAEASPVIARVLMAALWPTANRLRLHEISDAIDLWVADSNSDELRQQIQCIAKSEQDEGSRKHLGQMLRNQP